jgi:membrane protease YdiL (CAAX protease family)
LGFVGYLLDVFFILSALLCIPLINLLFEIKLRPLLGTETFLYRTFDLLTPRLRSNNIWLDITAGLTIALCVTIIILINVFLAERKSKTSERSSSFYALEYILPGRFLPNIALLMRLMIVSPVFEEIFYRGVVFIIAELMLKSTLAALLISASLFGLSHFRQGQIAMRTAFFSGIVLGVALYLKNNLFICIFSHAFFNLTILAIRPLFGKLHKIAG